MKKKKKSFFLTEIKKYFNIEFIYEHKKQIFLPQTYTCLHFDVDQLS